MTGDVEVKNAYHGKPWPHKSWSEEMVLELQKLWQEGLSASQCGRRLGVTRNAVIGLVHRKGPEMFARRGSPIKQEHPVRKRPDNSPVIRKARIREANRAITLAPIPAPRPGCDIMGLSDAICRFPLSPETRPPYRFCGELTGKEPPYCKKHRALAYQPWRGREL